MSEVARPAAAGRPAARQQEQQGGGMMKSLLQSVALFIALQFVMKMFLPNNSAPIAGGAVGGIPAFKDRPTSYPPGTQLRQIPENVAPIWPETQLPLDISLYVSPSLILPPFNKIPKESLVLDEHEFQYGDSKDKRHVATTIKLPESVQRNGTLWGHFFIGRSGAVLDPTDKRYDPYEAYYFVRPLTSMQAKKKVKKLRNLLDKAEETNTEEPEEKGTIMASHWHPNFTLSFVPETSSHNVAAMHPAMASFLNIEKTGARDETGKNGWYYPTLFVNTFWQLKNQMVELNGTLTEIPINIWLNNIPAWQFSIVASIDEGMKINAAKAARGEEVGPGGDGSEFEMFKEILLDTNIYLLSITGIVSILHMIFEGLAFKNDVSHWRKKKDNVGTSFRTILANVVMQTIILLYLFDNNERTSWMILFSQGIGIAIEAWKITKVVNVRFRPTSPNSMLPYTIVFEDKHKLSETEKKTDEYDAIAFKYMYIAGIPLILAYAVYSVIYESHKSWYSFIITTLVGSVYAYGFLMMVPSLYINYRLKSVAHMPGRAMTYKFLNTFIDDLFAFTIKMPLLHRLATLRDDVIFFVYLYQMWVYKVDYSRVNEFGQGGEEEDEKENAKKIDGEIPGKDTVSTAKAEVIDEVKATGVEEKGELKKRK